MYIWYQVANTKKKAEQNIAHRKIASCHLGFKMEKVKFVNSFIPIVIGNGIFINHALF